MALAASAATAQDHTRPYLSLDAAGKGVSVCVALAKDNGWNMSIVILDRGEDVVASARMDEALPASYKGATLKANTSLSWGMPTEQVNEVLEKAPVFKQFPGILGIAGGLPIIVGESALVGAIGVAGSSMENDATCAKAAVEAMR
ncbi:heme-binding protein [Pseudovibrio sp. Ad37]|uniref:GlcG/HbpS family heme-binding protein n=1 Tax=Pseudovibrio sp. Ad37 TaxID=989422 RepID=UPI001AD8F0E3|nr:heme-binding protein [Pseudovibrio sp. Ad37]